MDYAEFYYSQVVGYYPFDSDENLIQTEKTFAYLKEAGISDADLLRIIEESPAKDCLTPDDLPDWLWEGSLLKRDAFYFHHTLHIKPKAPVFSPVKAGEQTEAAPFFLELKIQYTMDDLLEYFYRTTGMNRDLTDKKRDAGSMNYLLNKYRRISMCEALDFVLTLIDLHRSQGELFGAVQNVLSLSEKETEAYEMLHGMISNATLYEADRIHWR